MAKDDKASMNEAEENILLTIEDDMPDGEQPPDAAESGYRRMCIDLYAYRLGTIDFLELLQRFERELGLPSPPAPSDLTLE